MFVVLVGQRADDADPDPRPRRRPRRHRLHAAARALALVHGPLRQLRRGDGGGPGEGAGGRAAGKPACRLARSAWRTRRTTWSSAPCSPPSCGAAITCWFRRATLIPADGEVVEGVASVDESAITGESAPVIRESGGDRSAVTGGTRVLSDWLVVRITANPGETFIDRMIALVEGASRQKTPERGRAHHPALGSHHRLPARGRDPAAVRGLQRSRGRRAGADRAAGLPHPHHDRRPALGHRHRRHGPADPAERHRDERPRGRGGGRREHAAARQDRHDHAGQPAGGRVHAGRRSAASRISPIGPSSRRSPDETPEGRSIVVLAKERFGLAGARRRERTGTRR